MNVKTMEGLAGAGTSISLVSTPMNVAKEAERKGDTEKMKRALSYAGEMTEQAEGYSEKTSQGMKLDAREAKEQEKLRQEELIKARKEEREKLEKQLQEGDGKGTETEVSSDSVEISEEGKHQRWQGHHLLLLWTVLEKRFMTRPGKPRNRRPGQGRM
jgi:hypothetical protein